MGKTWEGAILLSESGLAGSEAEAVLAMPGMMLQLRKQVCGP